MRGRNVTVDLDGPVAYVELNRSDVRNALNDAVVSDLMDAYLDLQTNWSTKVIVLGGKGPSFSAGADRREPPGLAATDASAAEQRWKAQRGLRLIRAIQDSNAITVARLQGHVIGGGLVLALACDFRVGSKETTFRVPEVGLGVALAWGGIPLLISEVGRAKARELVCFGDEFDGDAAGQLGILHWVVPERELDTRLHERVQKLVSMPELSLVLTKKQFRSSSVSSMGNISEFDSEVHIVSQGSDAARIAFPRS